MTGQINDSKNISLLKIYNRYNNFLFLTSYNIFASLFILSSSAILRYSFSYINFKP